MRMTHLVLAAALATGAALTAPAFARNADAQKGEEKSVSSPTCSAYQQAPDGSWEPLPCKEAGEHSQPQTQHKSGAQGAEQSER